MLPSAVLAPFASALADRWRRDLVLTLVAATRCATAAGMALLAAGDGPAVAVYALAIASTAAAILYRPVNSALLPLLCHTPSELASANVVRGLLDSVSTLVGPAIAAALLAAASISSGFAAVAVLSGLSAAVTLGLTVEEPAGHVEQELGRTRSSAGRRGDDPKPQLRLFVLLAAQTLTRGALSVFSVLIAVDLLDMGEPGVGTLTAAVGAGAVLGSLFALMYVGNRRLATWFGAGVATWGCAADPAGPGARASPRRSCSSP